jgi:hypothetical protein
VDGGRSEDASAAIHRQPNQKVVDLSYTIQNLATHPIFIFNRLYKTLDANRGYDVDPNLCTVDIRNDAVRVAKKIFPVPEAMHVEKLNLPCVSEITAGAELRETITLQTPLRSWHPYLIEDRSPRYAKSLPMIFELGYFLPSPAPRRWPQRSKRPSAIVCDLTPFLLRRN